MKEFIKSRFNALRSRRDSLTQDLADFYGGIEFLAASSYDRNTLEECYNIPASRRELWETKSRLEIITNAMALEDTPEAIEDYFELCSRAAIDALEKGLPEDASQRQIFEYIARAFERDECKRILTALTVPEVITAQKQARENASK